MDIITLKKSLCNTVASYDATSVVLKETDKSATLKEITMCDIPSGAIIVKMDNNVKFINFLKDTWGYNKHSDYLIVTDNRLVFIEMKSRSDVSDKLKEDCRQKFASDYCTLQYADAIFENLLSKNSFFDKRQCHYVLLCQATPLAKKPFASPEVSQPANTTPTTFRIIPISNGGTISYNRII